MKPVLIMLALSHGFVACPHVTLGTLHCFIYLPVYVSHSSVQHGCLFTWLLGLPKATVGLLFQLAPCTALSVCITVIGLPDVPVYSVGPLHCPQCLLCYWVA